MSSFFIFRHPPVFPTSRCACVGAKRRMPENAPQGQIDRTRYGKMRNFSFHRRIRAGFPDVLRRAMFIRPFRAQVHPRPERAAAPSPTRHVGAKRRMPKNAPQGQINSTQYRETRNFSFHRRIRSIFPTCCVGLCLFALSGRRFPHALQGQLTPARRKRSGTSGK